MTDEEKMTIQVLRKHAEDNDYWLSYEIETVLNLIEKQQKEIEILKEQKEYVINEYGRTIEGKDKIINEMALYIAGCDTDEDICKKWKPNNSCEDNGISCKECLIEYFEKKVGDKN